MQRLEEKLLKKIKVLTETLWGYKPHKNEIDLWLSNFCNDKEKLHALYLLSQFMYFANKEMRVLLQSMYRDLIRYPIISKIRKNNNDTKDIEFINKIFNDELEKTRFVGVGNPSESGSHLLYYFRQENELDKNLFINSVEIFEHNADKSAILAMPYVNRYVFIDDFSGSGTQAVRYTRKVVNLIKEINKDIDVYYFVLFANKEALKKIALETKFDRCDAIFKLDDTYKCFLKNNNRYFNDEEELDMDFSYEMAKRYGEKIQQDHPLGFGDNQLLLGFFHNIPNNTLPIIWFEGTSNPQWNPIFKRYDKFYGDKA